MKPFPYSVGQDLGEGVLQQAFADWRGRLSA